MMVLARKWLPGEPMDAEAMGAALFLEKSYWENMQIATQAAIGKAFSGGK